jgi:predicted peptidase
MEDRVFHGDRDDIVPLQESRKMVDALRKAGAEEVKFTRFEELMHDSWTAAYNDVEVFKWMFEHRRHEKGDERVVPEENKVEVDLL